MADNFKYDVFLSHSSLDEAVVRDLAERLRADGLRVWFGAWEIKPGDSIPAKIEEGLEQSRALVLCMSAQAFGSEWTLLEAGTFRFRDPLNKERRFIPLRFDDTPIKPSLAQFLYINWLPENRNQEYPNLLEACRPPMKQAASRDASKQVAEKVIQLDLNTTVYAYAFSLDGKRALTGSMDHTVQLWDVETGRRLRAFHGHTGAVWSLAWSADGRLAFSGSGDKTLRLWDVETGRCLRVFKGHAERVVSVVWSADQNRSLSAGAEDDSVRLWDVETGRCLNVFEAKASGVFGVTWSADGLRFLSGSGDNTVRLWDAQTERCLRVFEGHMSWVWSVAWSGDESRALSGSGDNTVRLWDVEMGHCLRVLEGHTAGVLSLAWSPDQRRALSGSYDSTVRLWDLQTGRCLHVFEGHTGIIRNVIWSPDGCRAFSGDENGVVRTWDLSEFVVHGAVDVAAPDLPITQEHVRYTNAKVLLVGESGSGKTGLSKRLALNQWEPSDSTVGAWATQWKLPVDSAKGVEREIWLWDFGGQADQRLIHQLYMDETALAILVFDGQKENLFENLLQWDRDLTRAAPDPFAKLLVAGRVDAGGLRVSRSQLDDFAKRHGYVQFLETSAKQNISCEDLRQAILSGIRWENIPWRSSPRLFKRLKEEIVRLKDEGRVLLRFNELRETLYLRLSLTGELTDFTDAELKAVVGLLAGPGVVWELKFGSWVLLQPERINAYAQAVIQTMREDEYERGCLPEERVLNGDLTYHSSMERLEADEERFVLLAMNQTLVERGLCLRQHTDTGVLLVFPSYYRRERPELVGHPAVLVSYRFSGFLDDIYATLVVRLSHTKLFYQDQLWRYAADFQTLAGKQLGIKLTRLAEGVGELQVYFDPTVSVGEKIIFSKYVHEHLLQSARDVVRLRYYVCPHCDTPIANRELAMNRLDKWLESRSAAVGETDSSDAQSAKSVTPTLLCAACENRVPLWDELEQLFASPDITQRVRELQEESAAVLDHESKHRALVGDIISTVALAGQFCRELNVSDHGIDMEIEFRSDAGEATGQKVYLEVKSDGALLNRRKSDGAEIFKIKNESHAIYWMEQSFPVLLVIRNAEGEVRWMEVRDRLRRASNNGKKGVRQLVFKGERFDVMSIRSWRERLIRHSQNSMLPIEIANLRINVAARRKATELSLSDLRLTNLPQSLWQITRLESLDLSGNLLTSLPGQIGKLKRLRRLNLARNQLASLPSALRRLARSPLIGDSLDSPSRDDGLKELFLHENPSLGIPREVLGPTQEEIDSSRGGREYQNVVVPAVILDYYFSTRGAQGRQLREVKLIVVGRGGTGKTSLIRRLKGEPLNHREPETHGISTSQLDLLCSDGPVKARVWDFGGQHILHAMHEFFLTARSVYLLVLGERDDMAERDATYWLQLIRSYAGSVPIVVALNKSQGHPREMDRATLEGNYGPILDWISTECDETVAGSAETIRNLNDAITRAVDQMPEVRDLFPAAWWQIKDWLEEMPEPYLDVDMFHEQCVAFGEPDPSRQAKLSARLHDLGIALNYSRDPRLRNTTVLRPDWLANGIYGLLRANDPLHGEKKLAPDAVLTTDIIGSVYAAAEQLGMLKSSDYPVEKWPFLLNLMTLFQLAYPLDDKGSKSLVPSLLPLEAPPDSDEPDDPDRQRLRYEFKVVPAPLLPRFLVRVFSLIEGEQRWRRGAILQYADARARVWSTPDERWLQVTAAGPTDDRDELLTIIRITLSDLFAEYKDLEVVEQWEYRGQWVPRETLDTLHLLSPTETPEEVRQ